MQAEMDKSVNTYIYIYISQQNKQRPTTRTLWVTLLLTEKEEQVIATGQVLPVHASYSSTLS
jgi:hypothetical protein